MKSNHIIIIKFYIFNTIDTYLIVILLNLFLTLNIIINL